MNYPDAEQRDINFSVTPYPESSLRSAYLIERQGTYGRLRSSLLLRSPYHISFRLQELSG